MCVTMIRNAYHTPNNTLVHQDLEVAVRKVVLMNTVPPTIEKNSLALNRRGKGGTYYITRSRVGTLIPVGLLLQCAKHCVWVAHRRMP